jgi:hypothetical protein
MHQTVGHLVGLVKVCPSPAQENNQIRAAEQYTHFLYCYNCSESGNMEIILEEKGDMSSSQKDTTQKRLALKRA